MELNARRILEGSLDVLLRHQSRQPEIEDFAFDALNWDDHRTYY